MVLPLEGVRVVDFTRVLAGPHCTKHLLDLGAEVIKIEPPQGDITRLAFPRQDASHSGASSDSHWAPPRQPRRTGERQIGLGSACSDPLPTALECRRPTRRRNTIFW